MKRSLLIAVLTHCRNVLGAVGVASVRSSRWTTAMYRDCAAADCSRPGASDSCASATTLWLRRRVRLCSVFGYSVTAALSSQGCPPREDLDAE